MQGLKIYSNALSNNNSQVGIRMQMITAHGTDFHIADPLCGESIGHL